MLVLVYPYLLTCSYLCMLIYAYNVYSQKGKTGG